MIRKKYIIIAWVLIFLLPLITGAAEGEYEKLMKSAQEKGYAKIILKLDVKDIKQLTEKSTQYKTIIPGARFPSAGVQADLDLEKAIETTTFSVLHHLNNMDYRVNHTYITLPYLALEVPPETLDILSSLPEILAIYEDKPTKLVDYWKEETSSKGPLEAPFISPGGDAPLLDISTSLIGADEAWNMGYTGSGWYVAILDTGIRRTHQFFQGKTIREACFSASHDCPNGGTSMYGTGAAAHYESIYYGYDHGTHVAGIAAGKYGSKAGVAKNSNIIAVQIFSRFGIDDCGDEPCVMSYDSDQVKGLEYIYTLRTTHSIAAANMSLGGGYYSSYCNSEPQKVAIDNLKAVRIATVIATGNDGYCGYIGSPACISSAVAVGASNDNDVEAYFNNWHSTLQELFAPGVSINSSTGVSNSSYESWSGTSMATPHVTGAWALMRQASPTASVNEIFNALTDTGVLITTLCWTGGACPRIQLDEAINELSGTTPTPTITVTSPNGGESWTVGSSQNITWTSTGSVSNVKIEYSTNNGSSWSTVVSSTANDGAYSWTIPDSPSSQCKVRIKEASDGSPSDTSNAVFSITTSSATPPEIAINRTQLNFSGIVGEPGKVTAAQVIWLNNSGGGTLNWTTTTSTSWLNCTPGSGTNAGVLTVSVNPTGLTTGNFSAIVNISDPDASNSPQSVTVNLNMMNVSQDQPPFGEFATPIEGSTARSSIPVTGWVLDDVDVARVKININDSYIGDAVFVEGARPDVEQAFPGYPKNYQAGWGYMLLTNMLPEGNQTLSVQAVDNAGKQVTLGSKTIKIDNASAVKPFGAIDTPPQGGAASGSKYRNQGWALTPQPNKIPIDGSTIKVFVDGVSLGHAVYNIYRSDIAALFPGYANSNGALAYFELDTTGYENGVHTIQWTATDNGGNSDGIGSRYFTVQNSGNRQQAKSSGSRQQATGNRGANITQCDYRPIRLKTGYNEKEQPQLISPDGNGTINIKTRELERLEIQLGSNDQLLDGDWYGFHVFGGQFRPLPIGSALDSLRGIFYWQPGPAFLGDYQLVFFNAQEKTLRRINVKILPKYR